MHGAETNVDAASSDLPRVGPESLGSVWTSGWLVFVGWALLTAAALWHVAHYALPMPFADQWPLVDLATGRIEPSLGWLFSLHNEHRMPVPKLAYLVVGSLTGYDYARMALMNTAVLSAVAAVCLLTMRRLRGGSSLVDLFAPAALLHFGHETNLTWCFQINFCLASGAAILALLVIAMARQPLRSSVAAGLAALLAIAAGCGTYGLLYVPPIAAWIGLCGAWQAHRRQTPPRQWLSLIFLSALLTAMFVAYVAAFPHGAHNPLSSPSLWQTLTGAHRITVTSLGPVGRGLKPLTNWLMIALIVGALYWLAREWRHGQASRMTLIGLACFLAAGLLLTLAIALARAGGGWKDMYQSRFGMLTAPLLIAMLLIWDRLSSSGARRQFAVVCLVLLPALVVANDRKGLRDARRRLGLLQEVMTAAEQGMPPAEISRRWSQPLFCEPADLERYLADLQAQGMIPYHTASRPKSVSLR
ncbi:MAG: hypothetical protein AB7U73_02080 [Pirellulales bacterium]